MAVVGGAGSLTPSAARRPGVGMGSEGEDGIPPVGGLRDALVRLSSGSGGVRGSPELSVLPISRIATPTQDAWPRSPGPELPSGIGVAGRHRLRTEPALASLRSGAQLRIGGPGTPLSAVERPRGSAEPRACVVGGPFVALSSGFRSPALRQASLPDGPRREPKPHLCRCAPRLAEAPLGPDM